MNKPIPITTIQSTAETLMDKAAIEIPEDYLSGLITVHKGGLFNTDYRMLFPSDGTEGIKRFYLDCLVASDKNGTCLFERENKKIKANLAQVYEGTRPATLKRFGETDDRSDEMIG